MNWITTSSKRDTVQLKPDAHRRTNFGAAPRGSAREWDRRFGPYICSSRAWSERVQQLCTDPFNLFPVGITDSEEQVDSEDGGCV